MHGSSGRCNKNHRTRPVGAARFQPRGDAAHRTVSSRGTVGAPTLPERHGAGGGASRRRAAEGRHGGGRRRGVTEEGRGAASRRREAERRHGGGRRSGVTEAGGGAASRRRRGAEAENRKIKA